MKKAIMKKRANFIDRLVGVFSPGVGVRRHYERSRLLTLRSEKYAAAKTTKSTGAWSPVNSSVNDIIRASNKIVRARVRQLVRDFPYFARAVNVLADYTVGAGITYQAKVLLPDGSGLNDKLNAAIEDAFSFWADEADFAGKLNYYEMMRIAKRQDAEPGEFMIIGRQVKDRNLFLPLKLQIVETDWLSDSSYAVKSVSKENTLDQGIEYETASGKVVAYHITDPDGWGKSFRVPAAEVIHGFETLRPGQLRGISPFAPGVLVADDLSSIMDAEIDATKMAAKWVALIKTADPYGRQLGNGTRDDDGKPIEDLENSIIEYLRPGEDVELKANPRPGTNFPPFVRMVLCMFSITTGVPYELISGDYQGMNYSTGKMVRNDFAQQLRPICIRHIRHFCSPTQSWFMDSAERAGRLRLPGFERNPWPYRRAEWQPPGMESVDPLRETKSKIDEMSQLLRSPQEIIRSRGRDPEAVLNEIQQFKAMADARGLSQAAVSTALANNPDAIDGGKDE